LDLDEDSSPPPEMKELATMPKTKTSQLHPREKETLASLC